MATVDTAYAAALLPSTDGRLWVWGLSSMPPVPISLDAVLSAAAALDPQRLAYVGEPVEIIPACLVQLSGTFQLSYPATPGSAAVVAAVALVCDNPPSLLVGVAQLDAPETLAVPGDLLLAQLDLTVGQQPGA